MATLTPTYADVSESVRYSIVQAVDVECVEGNPDTPRPEGLYATALLTSASQDGTAVRGASSMSSITEHVLTYSVQFYRAGAFQKACDYKAFMESSVHEFIGMFRYFRCSDVVRLDAVLSLGYEERAQLTVEVRVVLSLDDAAPNVASSGVNVNIEEVIDTIEARS